MSTNNLPKELKPGATAERFLTITEQVIDEEARKVTLAFSSELGVERSWGMEVLDHSPDSMRMGRLVNGAALLVDHDARDHVGVVEEVRIGEDRVARAVVRFGRSARASEVFQDVLDGIRRHVSVGYRIHDAVLEETREGLDVYRVTDWEPFEISIVSVPADPTVGVGRSNPDPEPHTDMRTPPMPEKEIKEQTIEVNIEAERQSGAEHERKRVNDIMAIADAYKRFGLDDVASDAVRKGLSVDEFRAKALEKMANAPKPSADIGMSEREVREYSVIRALNAMANPTDHRAREAAAYELEVSRAAADKLGKESRGILIPHDVLKRELVVGTPTAGGNLVATDLLSGSFIDMLRNAMVVMGLGTRMLTGLVGNIAIPKQTGGGTAYWVAEAGAPTAGDQAFAQVPMSPKTVAARTQISRKLLLQSSVDIENFVRGDLATTLGLAIQAAAIQGGGANEPTGILETAGIGDVAGGATGAAPTWDHIVDLETQVAVANADVGTLAYLTNAKVRGVLKKTFVDAGSGIRVWQNGDTPLNGYRAGITNAVPSNLTKSTGEDLSAIIFGNFADLMIGMWGGLDLQVDPYSAGNSGAVIVRAFQDVDVAVRHPESFAAMLDADA